MTEGNGRYYGNYISSLGSALRSGQHGLATVPSMLKQVLAEGYWREFVTERGELVQHQRFVDFVAAPPLKGIGSDVELIRRIVADDLETVDLLDQVLQNPAAVHAGNNVPSRPEGNSKEKALRRLRSSAPELHADVIAGRLSAHAAMVRAGYRPRTFTVRADSAASIADTLRRRLEPNELEELRKLLG